MNLAHLLLRSARWLPNQPAIALGARTILTYGELADRVARLASGLKQKLSLKSGDRVALAMKNCPEYHQILFACWHAGLTAVPINAKLHAKEFAYILENSGAKACFVTPETSSSIPGGLAAKEIDRLMLDPAAPADVDPDDPAWLFYTSGTTGVPKGAVLTHRNLMFQTHAYFADIDALRPGDTILHPAPLSHGSGCYALPHFAAGAANVIPESGGFDPEEIFDLLDHWPNGSLFAAPTMVVRLLSSRAARPPKKLKTIIYGGAPMYVADALRAIDLFGPR
ncbi:MAG: long-chain fatty acid--CoA ligase, partial [Burkholderiales bacterium]|nr:long-chain fatty acid--CoA ligase [Burkholderiales bacterium]